MSSLLRLPVKSDRFAWFVRLATFILVVAVLRFAGDVLMPFAFAVLLAFLLSPLVIRLTRWGLPRVLAIVLSVLVACSVIGATLWFVSLQAIALVNELPDYEENIRRKIVALKHPATPPVVSRLAGMVENLRRELKSTTPAAPPAAPAATEEPKPVPVEVKPAEATPFELAGEYAPAVLRSLGTGGLVTVLVIAILFQREDLRDRLIRLLSATRVDLATQALDDAASRVSRYLAMQLVVNAAYGIPLGLGLYFIGIPNAALWGLLATLLRFVPFVGPWIAAIFPVLLAIAVDPGWTMILYTLGLFVVLELISNNVVEIVLYGASTGISNFALLIAAVFWTWLWGAPGLVLSTPLTVCVLVLGTYFPGLGLLGALLGSQPALDPPTQCYQRLLAADSEDVLELAEKHLRQRSPAEFYDEVLLPAVALADEDLARGALPEARHRLVLEACGDLIDELERRQPGDAAAQPAAPSVPALLLVPVRDPSDAIAARCLAHLLRTRGVPANVTAFGPPLAEVVAAAHDAPSASILLSVLPPSPPGALRNWLRRLQEHLPAQRLFVGMWQAEESPETVAARLRGVTPPDVFTSLGASLDVLAGTEPTPAPAEAPGVPIGKIAAK